jgi:tyrosine-protein phosphatase YwqE
MVDIHSYKIVTAVQAGKTFMIKSLNHCSYKSSLVLVHLSGTPHHLRGLW